MNLMNQKITMQNPLRFNANSVHLWVMSFAAFRPYRHALTAMLSREERDHAGRFHRDDDRQRYQIGRGLIRCALACYLETRPHTIQFAANLHGKPSITDDVVHFNYAHSADRLMLAVCADAPVGIDIEAIKPLPDVAGLARQLFAPQEITALEAVPRDQVTRTFYTLWTRKEAYLKAQRIGLTRELDSFAVSAGDPAVILYDQAADVRDWSLYAFDPGAGCVGAVAVQQPSDRCQIVTIDAHARLLRFLG